MRKTVLVTGGSGEIGSAICQKFAENGYDVVISYNSNSQRAEAFIASLPEGNHAFFHAPTTDSEKVKAFKVFVE